MRGELWSVVLRKSIIKNEKYLVGANRRVVLSGLMGAGLCLAASSSRGSETVSSLPIGKVRELAARRGLLFGSAFDIFVYDDHEYARLLRQECQILTTDYSLKFGAIRPTPKAAHYESADRLFAFAENAKLLIRGHNLIWNEFLPGWVKHLSKAEISALLDRHIDETVGRYINRVHSWDVVNEPIWPDHGNKDGFRGGPWYEALGPDYIDRSFRRARQADPNVKLVLNEAGIEYKSFSSSRRRQYLLQLIKELRDKGTPLDVIGIESHLSATGGYDSGSLLEFVHSIQALGLDIYITELDVGDDDLPDDLGPRDRAVAACYANYIRDLIKVPAVKVITTWELSDKWSWRADGLRSGRTPGARWPRPLPFDIHMQPKPAYQAIADALHKI